MAFQTIAIEFGVAVGRWLISKWLGGGAKPHAPEPGTIAVPTTAEGGALSLVYGTRRLAGNVVAVGRNSNAPLKPDGITVTGYAYRVAFQVVFGTSNATPTYGAQAELRNLYVGDRVVTLEINPDPDTQYILENDFYGGTYAGGALRGRIIAQGGSWDQVAPPKWVTCITHALPGEPPSLDATLISGLRGQIVASFIGYEDERGMEIGESARLEPFAAEWYVPVAIPGYVPGTAAIGTGDSNPASVLYNLLVERGGVPASALDVASFAAAAAVFEAEEHGVSIEWTGGKVADHVKEIEAQTDCTIRRNPATGLYELKMIRTDYDPNDPGECPVFGPADVIGQPKVSATTWAEAFSEVRVTYLDRFLGYTERSASEQNGSLIDAQLGRRRTKEIRYPGVSNVGLAARLAARELNSIGRPITRVRLTLNRRAHRLRRGSVFRLQWPESNLNMVFRCVRVGLGTLERGVITVDALQDRFDQQRPGFTPPETVGPVTPVPRPIVDWLATEAPRWVLLKAFEAGLLANVDASRGYYLAAPVGDDVLWRARATIGAAAAAVDKGPQSFPGYFTVDADYPRTAGPYDTTVGIQIRGVDLVTLANATPTEIATTGRNLFCIVTTRAGRPVAHEILAFESYTDLGGNLYQLEDVWRGLLDTVPADHLEGAIGFFLPGPAGSSAIGAGVMPHGAAVDAFCEAASNTWTPTADSPEIVFTARSRTLLPYPAARLQLNGSVAPADITDDEGVAITWRDRLRTAGTITRGDAASEIPEAGITYNAVAYKGAGPQEGGDQVTLVVGHTSGTTKIALGAAGHGLLEVGVDAQKAVTLPDATTPTLGALQVPTLEILAAHYRNLLLNPRFADGTGAGWTWTIGTPAVGTSNALGGAGSYITGAPGTALLDGYQTRSIVGYRPSDLRARLRFAAVKNPAGTGTDTVTVYLYSLDDAGATLDTQTYGPSAPAAWTWPELAIARLHADTASIKLRIVLTGAGATVAAAVTELDLRVGQMSGQALLNPSFEANPVAPVQSWTEEVGTFQGLTATKYGSPTYVRPNDGASATLRQDATVPTGYEGSVATLICGRMNDAASDTGKVSLIARDAVGSTLATVATADEAIAPSNTWARRFLALELPAATATVRVQFDATRVSGTPLNACADDFYLEFHKPLDPGQVLTVGSLADDGADPVGPAQRLPANRYQWYRDFPNVLAPNHAIYAGSLAGKLGTEPPLELVGDDAIALATFVADMGLPSGAQTTAAFEMRQRGADEVRVAPIGASFGNFAAAESWAILIAFKVGEPTWGGEANMVSRWDTVGWALGIDGAGKPTIVITGDLDEGSVTGDQIVTAGDLQLVGVVYDPLTSTATLVDALGTYDLDTSALGEFRGEDVGRLTFWGGATTFGGDRFVGQIAPFYAWRGAAPTAADLQSVITYTALPSALHINDVGQRTGSIAIVVGEDARGVLVDTLGPGRLALGYLPGFERRGFACMPAAVNLAPTTFTNWTASGGTVTSPAAPAVVGPDGYATPAAISGTNTQGYLTPALALGSAGTRHVQGFARADVAHTARIVLKNNSGTVIATADYAVGTTWQPFAVAVAWDGSTSGVGKILASGSSSGSVQAIHLSPLLYVGTQPVWPGMIPIGNPGATAPTLLCAPTEAVNREGELAVELVADVALDRCAAHAWNGTNANDERRVAWIGGGDVVGSHATGAGSNTDATISGSAADPSEPHTLKVRWQRAGLVDGTAGEWTSVRAEQGGAETASGRSATWSASATPPTKIDVGHDDGGDVLAGIVFGVSLKSREPRL